MRARLMLACLALLPTLALAQAVQLSGQMGRKALLIVDGRIVALRQSAMWR